MLTFLEKMSTCHNNPKKIFRRKKTMRKASGYSMLTQCSFDTTKNKVNCCNIVWKRYRLFGKVL